MYVVTFDMGTNKTYNMDWTVTAKQLMTPNMPFKQRVSYTLGLAHRPSTSECGIDCETESDFLGYDARPSKFHDLRWILK